jgi:O-antigen/teichoic acid export membrane protein
VTTDRSPLLRSLRAALPLLGAQAVLFGLALLLGGALLLFLSREDLAHFGRMREALRWVVVAGTLGLPTGLLRLGAERVGERGALLGTSLAGAGVLSVFVLSAVLLLPGVGGLLLGDEVALGHFVLFGMKAPLVAVLAVAISFAHASGRLGRKAGLEVAERVLVFAGSVAGAAFGGLAGLVLGSLLASAAAAAVAAAVALRQSAGEGSKPGFRRELLGPLLRVGRARTGVMLLEAFRPLLLLRVMTERGGGDAETGLLVAAMMLTLPLVAVPERLAQAAYRDMVGEKGEAPDLSRTGRRLLLELAVLAVPALLLAGGAFHVLLSYVRGGEHAGAAVAVWILLPGVAAHGLAAHLGYVILVRHRLGQEALVSGVTLVATVVLAWLAAPRWGTNGAAGALGAALILRTGLLAVVALRKSG